jgi:hypothetical protein
MPAMKTRWLVPALWLAMAGTSLADKVGPAEAPRPACRFEGSEVNRELPLESARGVPLGSVMGKAQVALQLEADRSPITLTTGALHLEVQVPTAKLRLTLASTLTVDPVTQVLAGAPLMVAPGDPTQLRVDPKVLADYTPATPQPPALLSCTMAIIGSPGAQAGPEPGLTRMLLRPARVAIAATAGGKPVGTVKRSIDDVLILGQSGTWTEVEIEDEWAMFHGWIATSALKPYAATGYFGELSGREVVPGLKTCDHKIVVLAGTSGKTAEVVGWLAVGGQFLVGKAAKDLSAISVPDADGLSLERRVHLYVSSKDLAGCK